MQLATAEIERPNVDLPHNKNFELMLRKLVDSKYDREVEPNNPFHRLLTDQLPIEECREMYKSMWNSLMVFNRVLLARLLATAPNVPVRVELMGVIAQEYGPRLDDAHPMLFLRFLNRLGVPREELPWDSDLETGPSKDEVKLLRSLSFVELLARILVGETLGPVAFPAVSEALQRNYKLSDHALAYFKIHAVTDKKDAEILFDLLRREVKTDEDAQKVVKIIEESFAWGRYRALGCKLPETDQYRYTRLFERRLR